MTEPRARQRNKGGVFNEQDLRELLYAFGSTPPHTTLPTTTLILDEILTDFIIETCHAAATCASYSRRQKIKVDDFRWVLRRNGPLLGRVNEQLFREKKLKEERRAVDLSSYGTGKEGVEELGALAEVGGAEREIRKKGRGKGRRKRKVDEVDGAAAEGDAKPTKKFAT